MLPQMAMKPTHVALGLLGALLAVVPSHLVSGPGSPAILDGAGLDPSWVRVGAFLFGDDGARWHLCR